MNQRQIIIAMSGGVDSSVAAALLVEQGYDVTGAFMINYDDKAEGHGECWRPDYRDAVRVAAKLGIPLLRIDCTKEYREQVIGYMLKEYQAGNTPNPDVMCNKYIKFGVWLEKLKEKGFDRIATGHYANIEKKNGQYFLTTAKDENKDQTYFLHQLNQTQLSHIEFPLGKYTKDEVRLLAKKYHLPTAEKAESMGICFIGEISINDFLKDNRIIVQPGNIIKDETEEVIGEHEGLPFYTIGQRHGFTQTGGDQPLFILEKHTQQNELIVGYEDNPKLYKTDLIIQDMHWIIEEEPVFPFDAQVRFRHRQKKQPCRIQKQKNEIMIHCTQPQKAITPGQFVVIYKNSVCLGGGPVTNELP